MNPHASRRIVAEEITQTALCAMDEKIVFTEDCWLWTGSKTDQGYGNLRMGDRTVLAHRAVHALCYGETPAGKVLRHRCDTPLCVRPDHLVPGTQADNQRDMAIRGRGTLRVSNEQAREIVRLHRRGLAQYVIADRFGISKAHVSRIVRGVSRHHVTGLASAS